jgi:REP element-mobilizing transposase RayT
MPRAGHLWRHVIINTRNTWLHGDQRGFRSRNPDIRSSGDYKHPPPPEEYRKLREYFEKIAGDEVHFERALRVIIGRVIGSCFGEQGYRVLAVSVGKVHAHAVVELPEPRATVKRIVGEAKRKSSRAVKEWLPGSVWAAGGEYVICESRSHLECAVDYVLYKQGRGAWTWSFRDSLDEGVFARKRPAKRVVRRRT